MSTQPAEPVTKDAATEVVRLDKYQRMLHRFYEPLMLLELKFFGDVRGPRTLPSTDLGDRNGLVRAFLTNLAVLGDHKKGGKTVLAIAVEDAKKANDFWVAANTDRSGKIVPFIQRTLRRLKSSPDLGTNLDAPNAKSVIDELVRFGEKKVKEEAKCLSRETNECLKLIEGDGASQGLGVWLKSFDPKSDCVSLCTLAYEQRHSNFVRTLEERGRDTKRNGAKPDRASPYVTARHYIGRLAHRLRAARELVEASHQPEIRSVLDVWRVKAVPIPECVPRPLPDGQTTIKGICNRMFRDPRDPMKKTIINKLHKMDQSFQIIDEIKLKYEDTDFKPRVHAEIQILDHFYLGQRLWLNGDRFIACSKPACYCCHLYIRHHPAGCVVPETHQRIYLNWGPRLLPLGVEDEGYREQLRLLSKMTDDIRKDAISQLEQDRAPHEWHPDSNTLLTRLEPIPPIGNLTTRLQGLRMPSSENDQAELSNSSSETVIYAAPPSEAPSSPKSTTDWRSRLSQTNTETTGMASDPETDLDWDLEPDLNSDSENDLDSGSEQDLGSDSEHEGGALL